LEKLKAYRSGQSEFNLLQTRNNAIGFTTARNVKILVIDNNDPLFQAHNWECQLFALA
jgi:hypothetical protein